jgi:ribonuclease BN (tRNA processing enzyme)
MRLKVLGCYGNVIGPYRATSFLVNEDVLIDAGTVTEVLGDDELARLTHVLISHTHVDHVKGLFPLVDELVMLDGEHRLELVSVGPVVDIISKNLFNNLIWPDFTVIPSEREAIMNLRSVYVEEEVAVAGLTVKPVQVTHTVYTVGYVVKEGDRGFMFTADTGNTGRFWEVAGEEEGIEFIIADVSFPNRLERLARISGHMTLSMLRDRLEKYKLTGMPVYLTHMKPIFMKEILNELESAKVPNLRLLEQDAVITL